MGNEMLPKEWVEELCTRLARALDANNEPCEDCEEQYHDGYQNGYDAALEDNEE